MAFLASCYANIIQVVYQQLIIQQTIFLLILLNYILKAMKSLAFYTVPTPPSYPDGWLSGWWISGMIMESDYVAMKSAGGFRDNNIFEM